MLQPTYNLDAQKKWLSGPRNLWLFGVAKALFHNAGFNVDLNFIPELIECLRSFDKVIHETILPFDVCIHFIAYLDKQLASFPKAFPNERMRYKSIKNFTLIEAALLPCFILAGKVCCDESIFVVDFSDVFNCDDEHALFVERKFLAKIAFDATVEPIELLNILTKLDSKTLRHDFYLSALADAAMHLIKGNESHATDFFNFFSDLKEISVDFIAKGIDKENLLELEQRYSQKAEGEKTAKENDFTNFLNILSLLPKDTDVIAFLVSIETATEKKQNPETIFDFLKDNTRTIEEIAKTKNLVSHFVPAVSELQKPAAEIVETKEISSPPVPGHVFPPRGLSTSSSSLFSHNSKDEFEQTTDVDPRTKLKASY